MNWQENAWREFALVGISGGILPGGILLGGILPGGKMTGGILPGGILNWREIAWQENELAGFFGGDLNRREFVLAGKLRHNYTTRYPTTIH